MIAAEEGGTASCSGIYDARVLRILAVVLVNTVTNALSRRDLEQRAVLRIDEQKPARLESKEHRELLFKALTKGRVLLLAHEFADYTHNIKGLGITIAFNLQVFRIL